MKTDDVASCVTLEVFARAARIIPVLDAYLDVEDHAPLNELQRIGLGSVVLQVFAGLEEVLAGMLDVSATLERFAPTVGDEAERWLASRDDLELQ